MRIALVHSFYAGDSASGENVVVQAQLEALSRAGHSVLLLGRHTDRESSKRLYPIRAAYQTATGAGPDPTLLLARFDPQVVHIHNTVPNIGSGWLAAWPTPVVHTLHNFRPICANGLLFRDGHVCTDCPSGRPWSAVEHACYRDSRLATLPVAVRNSRGLASNELLTRADRLIALSDYAADTFRRFGLPGGRLVTVPNGVSNSTGAARPAPTQPRWLAVGRLRAEKGFAELLRGWPAGHRLDIAGDGPQREELARLAGPEVRLRGAVPASQLRRELPGYSGLVFAGLCPEAAVPLVVVEALEAGLPVLMTRTSPHAEPFVSAQVARTVRAEAPAGAPPRLSTEDLLAGMAWAESGADALRGRCRAWFEQNFTEDLWVRRLEQVYRDCGA
jgi:glycosyltransferase involved in cell wall biosynthesis